MMKLINHKKRYIRFHEMAISELLEMVILHQSMACTHIKTCHCFMSVISILVDSTRTCQPIVHYKGQLHRLESTDNNSSQIF